MRVQELDPSKPYIISVSDMLMEEDLQAIKAKLVELGVSAIVVADIPTESKIGHPSKSISAWLREFAADNDSAAENAFWPWAKARYRSRAAAFREALRMVWSAS